MADTTVTTWIGHLANAREAVARADWMRADDRRATVAALALEEDRLVASLRAPTTMPAPALGMRAWCTAPDIGDKDRSMYRNYDVRDLSPGATWADYINDNDTIDLITNFRTREVIWRRE